MLLPCYAPIRLPDKIEAWRQEVERQSQATASDEECTVPSGHGMRLRSTNARTAHSLPNHDRRPALAAISIPNQSVSSHFTRRKSSVLTSFNPKPSAIKFTKRKASIPVSIASRRPKSAAKTSTLVPPSKKGRAVVARRAKSTNMSKGKGKMRYDSDADEEFPSEQEFVPTAVTPQRKPGRPRKVNDNNPHLQTATMQHQMQQIQLNDAPQKDGQGRLTRSGFASYPQTPSKSTTPSKSATPSMSHSPSKPRTPSRSRTASSVPVSSVGTNQGKIAENYLKKCDPPVYLMDKSQILRLKHKVPESVKKLWDMLKAVPAGATIPSALEQKYVDKANTPRQTREPPDEHEYLRSDKDMWTPVQREHLMKFIEHVLEMAHFSGPGPECQWGDVVSQILNAFALWEEGELIRSINL
ncbi:MAG: hypothetical protein Q9202_005796 [Teloschistes flavicans]